MKSIESYSKLHLAVSGTTAILMVIFVFSSCTKGNGSRILSIKDNPAGAYREYLHEIKGLDSLSTEELAEHINRWLVLRDSVFQTTGPDSSPGPHSDLHRRCVQLHDSLRAEFSRLAQSSFRSYQDVFSLKERTSPYSRDSDLASAAERTRPFFISLDSIPVVKEEKNRILSRYRKLLAETLIYGIHDKDDLESYVKKEDVIFRAFLAHLNGFEDENLADITQNTERCRSEVFHAAERSEITYKDAVVYMAMRTNRRLIQNTSMCLKDIQDDKIKSKAHAWGYAYMILQPYVLMDGICTALLSVRERDELRKIAGQTPAALSKLKTILETDEDGPDNLPGILMGIYIQTL